MLQRQMAAAREAEPALGNWGKVGIDIVNHVFRDTPLVIKEVKSNTNSAITGLLVQLGNDNVVIDAGESSGHITFANALANMPLEIVDGSLQVEVDGVRKRCRQIGVFEDLESAPGRLVLPKRFHVPRVETLASKDDSFGKAKWRREIRDFATEVFAEKGWDPKRDGRALIFGGLGEEIDMWRSFGLDEENIYSIEEDQYIAEEQARRFPKVKIFRHNFEGNIMKLRRFISKNGLTSKGYASPVDFSIVNLDPESKLTRMFIASMRNIRSTQGVYAYNFYGKREGSDIKGFLTNIIGHVKTFHCDLEGISNEELNSFSRDAYDNMLVGPELDKLRKLAMQALLDYVKCDGKACGGKYKTGRSRALQSQFGEYEASGGGKMIYAMHQI